MRAAATALLASCILALAAAGGAGAQTAAIGPGVSVAGVDVSGLTVEAAAARLSGTLAPQLGAETFVGAGGRVFRLTASQAGERFDALTSAKRALALGHPGAAPPALSHAHLAVRRFVAQIAGSVDRAATDATVTITVQHILRRAGRDGHVLAQGPLAAGIDQALDSPGTARVFHVKLVRTHPHLSTSALPGAYPTILTVDRGHFKLRVFRRLRLIHTYGIAVGRAGLQTPTGLYHVREREVNPSWHVPNSAWAGALAGTTVPPGPNDPIVARWMGLADGIGIHGTNEPFSIGSAASHGCIRMLVPDVIAVYRLTSIGTPVLIR